MSNKVKDEVVATIRSIVGQNYSEMDIIRALHMANNDATGAINIIFDTPNFIPKIAKPPIRQNPGVNSIPKNQVPSSNSIPALETNSIPAQETNENFDPTGDLGCGQEREKETSCGVSHGDEWWLVACSEIAGMSTCKGRRIRVGDEINFAFPLNNRLNSPSPGKGFGRGRNVGSCLEIVRFSTKDGGEVAVIICKL